MKNKLLVLISVWTLTACGNPLGNKDSIVDQGHRPGQEEILVPTPGPSPSPTPGATHRPGAGSTLVSSAVHLKSTGRGYKFSQTVGELSRDLNASTSRGYKFFSNLQGSFVSE